MNAMILNYKLTFNTSLRVSFPFFCFSLVEVKNTTLEQVEEVQEVCHSLGETWSKRLNAPVRQAETKFCADMGSVRSGGDTDTYEDTLDTENLVFTRQHHSKSSKDDPGDTTDIRHPRSLETLLRHICRKICVRIKFSENKSFVSISSEHFFFFPLARLLLDSI